MMRKNTNVPLKQALGDKGEEELPLTKGVGGPLLRPVGVIKILLTQVGI